MRYRPTDAGNVIARILAAGLDTVLTSSEAVAVVAAFLDRPHPADRVRLNAVRTKLKRHATQGRVRTQSNGGYRAEDLLLWARAVYGEPAFGDLPPTPITVTVRLRSGIGISAKPAATILPPTLPECLRLIREKELVVEQLEAEAAERERQRKADLAGRFRGKRL